MTDQSPTLINYLYQPDFLTRFRDENAKKVCAPSTTWNKEWEHDPKWKTVAALSHQPLCIFDDDGGVLFSGQISLYMEGFDEDGIPKVTVSVYQWELPVYKKAAE